MKRPIAIAAGALLACGYLYGARARLDVTYSSECSCENDVGVKRWRAKTDPSDPPMRAADILPITPFEISDWKGAGMVPWGGGRTGNEFRWYALTGRVVTMQAENDGDVHLVLVNADDERPGKVIVEIPLGAKWCALRTTAFSWTNALFPFHTNGQFSPFRLVHKPIITVIGRAFYDTDHAGKDRWTNRRPRDKEKAVWEIHPVIRMEVKSADAEAAASNTKAVGGPQAALPAPVVVATQPAATPEQLVTITCPVAIKIPYGEAVLQPGMKLPVVSRDANTVRVRYMGGIQPIPVAATDAQ